MPGKTCANCGGDMSEGPFPYAYTCDACGATVPAKKTEEKKQEGGKKAAETKKKKR